MTEDEKLVEKVAEAMWNALKWHSTPWAEALDDDNSDYRTLARAAIAAVREHDGYGVKIGGDTVLEIEDSTITPSSLTVPHRHMKGGIQG